MREPVQEQDGVFGAGYRERRLIAVVVPARDASNRGRIRFGKQQKNKLPLRLSRSRERLVNEAHVGRRISGSPSSPFGADANMKRARSGEGR